MYWYLIGAVIVYIEVQIFFKMHKLSILSTLTFLALCLANKSPVIIPIIMGFCYFAKWLVEEEI